VGFEVRTNTNQSKLQNWASLIDRFIMAYSESGILEFSEELTKGRENDESLRDGERITYGNCLYQICAGLEALVNFSRNDVHGQAETEAQFDRNIQHHLGCPGDRV
jgi:hypothetical protein